MSDQITTHQYLTLNGQELKQLLLAGLAWLEQHYQIVNQLNVFPVPDGDTGINMLLTMQSAYSEIADDDDTHIGNIFRRFAVGAVNGSRGNSGVILSQIWRGFGVALKDVDTVDVTTFSAACNMGVKFAYDAAPKPAREGTILTVMRESAEQVEEDVESTPELTTLLTQMLERAKDALRRTPEMLDVLKKAGVVDSGGQGLVYIFEGMLRQLRGESMEAEIEQSVAAVPARKPARVMSATEFGHPYDVQLLLAGPNLEESRIRAAIETMGDSAIVTGDGENHIKVHVHVYDPGRPISYAAKLGIVSDVVVENMYEQYLENIGADTGDIISAPTVDLLPDDVAVVAVVPGNGLVQIFYEQDAARIIRGGQTMNPSTEEIIDAINDLAVEKVIILPNNTNIILAAQQAAQQLSNRVIEIVASKNVPQGISAMLAYANVRLNDTHRHDINFIANRMRANLEQVLAGEITRAVRSVELNGVESQKGQLIGLLGGELAAAGDDMGQLMRDLIDQIDDDEYELITLYYGTDVTRKETEELVEMLAADYTAFSFEIFDGGQPHYYYLLGIE